MNTAKQVRYDELIDDMVAIARGKPLKPEAGRYPYDGKWLDVTTAKDRRRKREYKRKTT